VAHVKRWSALIALLVLVFGLPGGGAVAQDGNVLGRDLDRLLADPRLAGASAGLVVRDADSGELLYTRSGAGRMAPASNAKLITTATALEVLGVDHRLHTDVLTDGRRHGGFLDGNLYLRGTGDPTMLAKDYQGLAASLATGGVRVVRGSLVADDTWFDAERLGTGWAWDDEPYYYNAQISALTVSPDTDYDAGSVVVRVKPATAAGGSAQVELDPPTDYLKIDSTATTGPGDGISVDREHGTNVIRVRGSIPVGAPAVTEFIAVWNPTAFVASIFRKALADNGIRVIGGTEFRATPRDAEQLASRQSMPLGELLVPLLKLSNNMHSEMLVKSAGRKEFGVGSWEAGLRALSAELPALGVDPAVLRLHDGSGLSRMDLVAPDQIVALLTAAKGKPWFDTWYRALPVAGEPDRLQGGTLRNRMRGTAAQGNVHAKTGSLTGVTALSGYVTSADGRHLVFSLMQNDFVSEGPRDIEDAVAIRLANLRAGQGELVGTRSAAPVSTGSDLECSWTKSC
jgi:D-alanyl-D-alanine carboxypeptidase/D-alanyl-D-alanine-endopeptidase (penicillin-binding protein 4)